MLTANKVSDTHNSTNTLNVARNKHGPAVSILILNNSFFSLKISPLSPHKQLGYVSGWGSDILKKERQGLSLPSLLFLSVSGAGLLPV